MVYPVTPEVDQWMVMAVVIDRIQVVEALLTQDLHIDQTSQVDLPITFSVAHVS